jgi:hypothetical protein
MSLLALLLACGSGTDTSGTRVTFDSTRSGTSATTVQGAIDELYARCKTAPAAVAEGPDVSAAAVDLSGRIQLLELRQTELLTNGVYGAEKVTYDPRDTTLSGRTVQAALDELEARVEALERGTVDQGEPGPALFELRDKHGKLVPAGNAPGGQQGPPPGGAPGGPGQGAPPQGGQGGQGGQQGGQQGGGGSAPRK